MNNKREKRYDVALKGGPFDPKFETCKMYEYIHAKTGEVVHFLSITEWREMTGLSDYMTKHLIHPTDKIRASKWYRVMGLITVDAALRVMKELGKWSDRDLDRAEKVWRNPTIVGKIDMRALSVVFGNDEDDAETRRAARSLKIAGHKRSRDRIANSDADDDDDDDDDEDDDDDDDEKNRVDSDEDDDDMYEEEEDEDDNNDKKPSQKRDKANALSNKCMQVMWKHDEHERKRKARLAGIPFKPRSYFNYLRRAEKEEILVSSQADDLDFQDEVYEKGVEAPDQANNLAVFAQKVAQAAEESLHTCLVEMQKAFKEHVRARAQPQIDAYIEASKKRWDADTRARVEQEEKDKKAAELQRRKEEEEAAAEKRRRDALRRQKEKEEAERAKPMSHKEATDLVSQMLGGPSDTLLPEPSLSPSLPPLIPYQSQAEAATKRAKVTLMESDNDDDDDDDQLDMFRQRAERQGF